MGTEFKIGKRYLSVTGNTVHIIEELDSEDADGRPVKKFVGSVVRTIKGHESLMSKIHRFNHEGKWLNERGNIVVPCLHDLAREAT